MIAEDVEIGPGLEYVIGRRSNGRATVLATAGDWAMVRLEDDRIPAIVSIPDIRARASVYVEPYAENWAKVHATDVGTIWMTVIHDRQISMTPAEALALSAWLERRAVDIDPTLDWLAVREAAYEQDRP